MSSRARATRTDERLPMSLKRQINPGVRREPAPPATPAIVLFRDTTAFRVNAPSRAVAVFRAIGRAGAPRVLRRPCSAASTVTARPAIRRSSSSKSLAYRHDDGCDTGIGHANGLASPLNKSRTYGHRSYPPWRVEPIHLRSPVPSSRSFNRFLRDFLPGVVPCAHRRHRYWHRPLRPRFLRPRPRRFRPNRSSVCGAAHARGAGVPCAGR